MVEDLNISVDKEKNSLINIMARYEKAFVEAVISSFKMTIYKLDEELRIQVEKKFKSQSSRNAFEGDRVGEDFIDECCEFCSDIINNGFSSWLNGVLNEDDIKLIFEKYFNEIRRHLDEMNDSFCNTLMITERTWDRVANGELWGLIKFGLPGVSNSQPCFDFSVCKSKLRVSSNHLVLIVLCGLKRSGMGNDFSKDKVKEKTLRQARKGLNGFLDNEYIVEIEVAVHGKLLENFDGYGFRRIEAIILREVDFFFSSDVMLPREGMDDCKTNFSPSPLPKNNSTRAQILEGKLKIIAGEANQLFDSKKSDNGIDGEIEFFDDEGNASGRKVYVQLKNGNSYLQHRQRDGKEIFKVKSKNRHHLKYWTDHAEDVYLVIRQDTKEKGEVIRWMNITRYLKNRQDKDSLQIIFTGEILDVQAILRVRNEILGGGI